MAHKKGVGSSRNGRDSAGRRLGVKRYGGETVLAWAEAGGPTVGSTRRPGFGSRLLEVALRAQGGKVEPRFHPAGFQASIHFPAPTQPAP